MRGTITFGQWPIYWSTYVQDDITQFHTEIQPAIGNLLLLYPIFLQQRELALRSNKFKESSSEHICS